MKVLTAKNDMNLSFYSHQPSPNKKDDKSEGGGEEESLSARSFHSTKSA